MQERREVDASMPIVWSKIEEMKQRLRATGAFDEEPSQLETIQQDLLNGRISPEAAEKLAQRMMNSRSEYH